ncbi:hypothetical protein ACXR0O_26445 [Verrucomicrobiota bacterium sgz303538]
MKRISFVLAAALALAVNACEKHSAAETSSALHSEHAATEHEGAAKSHEGGEVHAAPAPHAPEGVPVNPAGSGPTDAHDPAKDKGTGGSGDPGAYKYFPKDEKK